MGRAPSGQLASMWIRIAPDEMTRAPSGFTRRMAMGAVTARPVTAARTGGSDRPLVSSWVNTAATATTENNSASSPSATSGFTDRSRSSWRSTQFTCGTYRTRPVSASAMRRTAVSSPRRTS